MNTESIRRRVVVHGRVQGVFFRDSVRQQARDAGVSGSVCNRQDGVVEAIFEGSAEAVGRLVDFCRQGPESAEVDRVDIHEEEPQGLSGFDVR